MGAAFGGIVHLSPAAREQGEAPPGTASGLGAEPHAHREGGDRDAAPRQHLNVDSAPGIPATPADIEAHVNRLRTAIEQLERGQPVEVSGIEQPKFEADPARVKEATRHAEEVERIGERVRKAEGIPEVKDEEPAAARAPKETEAPAAIPGGEAEPPPPRGDVAGGEAAGAEATDPVRMTAERIADERPDRLVRIGTDADGAPITKTMRKYLDDARQATQDAIDDKKLFDAAAMCLLGKA
jgi:hypothetical protein